MLKLDREYFNDEINKVLLINRERILIRYIRNDGSLENITCHNFQKTIIQLEAKLTQQGVKEKQKITILHENSYSACICYIASIRAGAIPVILDYSLPIEEKTERINIIDTEYCLMSTMQYNIFNNSFEESHTIFIVNNEGSVDRVIAKQNPSIIYNIDISEEDFSLILFSSGTTSRSKGVMFSFDVWFNPKMNMKKFCGNLDVRFLFLFPLFHLSGIATFILVFLGGGEFGVVEDFTPIKIKNALLIYKPTLFGMIHKVYDGIADQIVDQILKKGPIKSFFIFVIMDICGFFRKYFHLKIGKYIFSNINKQVFGGKLIIMAVGGGISKKDTCEVFLKLGYEWLNIYASTEANLAITFTSHKDAYPSDYVGLYDIFSNVKIIINNPDINGVGEIYIKSEFMMAEILYNIIIRYGKHEIMKRLKDKYKDFEDNENLFVTKKKFC